MTLHHWPNPRVPWRSFHNHWVVRLVEYLNQGVLPDGFRARPTELIVGIEPDVLLLREADSSPYKTAAQPVLAEATLTAVLPPPAESPIVGIYSAYDNSRLVAAIELVSPGNKDRPEAVQAFVEKVLFLLQEGVHVMVVDVIRKRWKPAVTTQSERPKRGGTTHFLSKSAPYIIFFMTTDYSLQSLSSPFGRFH
jgi:hypothetical protein